MKTINLINMILCFSTVVFGGEVKNKETDNKKAQIEAEASSENPILVGSWNIWKRMIHLTT